MTLVSDENELLKCHSSSVFRQRLKRLSRLQPHVSLRALHSSCRALGLPGRMAPTGHTNLCLAGYLSTALLAYFQCLLLARLCCHPASLQPAIQVSARQVSSVPVVMLSVVSRNCPRDWTLQCILWDALTSPSILSA